MSAGCGSGGLEQGRAGWIKVWPHGVAAAGWSTRSGGSGHKEWRVGAQGVTVAPRLRLEDRLLVERVEQLRIIDRDRVRPRATRRGPARRQPLVPPRAQRARVPRRATGGRRRLERRHLRLCLCLAAATRRAARRRRRRRRLCAWRRRIARGVKELQAIAPTRS
eukprot:3247821-Prymnesium_polylepis.1